ncbi:MAG: phage Gp37/Gp68 family protein [Comamonadaceae bacterium]|nr:phage Gp37/Gp68 family protein [Comamonadaceae bacterium]
MGDTTHIEWTDATWNPVTGCTRVSPGCVNCYIDWAPPFRVEGRHFTDRDGNRSHAIGATTGVRLHPDRLDWPLRKRSWRGKRVFVCSLADLFHDDVPDEYIARVFAVMALTPEVTYQVLTKRPARMRALLASGTFAGMVWRDVDDPSWPLPNVWMGVTVEDQERADLRIPILLDTPAAVRWLSCEPLLGPVDLDATGMGVTGTSGPESRPSAVDWVVAGGESGPNARPMHPSWARSLRDQCATAGVPFLFKQWGEWAPDEWIDEDGCRHVGRKPEARDSKSLVMHPAGMTALTPDNPFDPWEHGHPCWHTVMRRVGKKRAGRLLDGAQHDGYPGGEA